MAIIRASAAERFDEGCVNAAPLAVTRTTDPEIIRRIVGDPAIRPFTWDQPGEIPVPIHESVYHLLADIGGEVAGLVTFIQINWITWNPHVCVLPEFRGNGSRIVTHAMKWMFAHSPCEKVVAHPPSNNPAIIRVFEKCGFEREGFSPRSFKFGNQVCDRILFGLRKEQLCGEH